MRFVIPDETGGGGEAVDVSGAVDVVLDGVEVDALAEVVVFSVVDP